MFQDDIIHARHTAVTEFDFISIGQLIIFMVTEKMLVNKPHKNFNNVVCEKGIVRVKRDNPEFDMTMGSYDGYKW